MMQQVLSRLDADGRVELKIVTINAHRNPVKGPRRQWDVRRTICLVCHRPVPKGRPHGWTCADHDPVGKPVPSPDVHQSEGAL